MSDMKPLSAPKEGSQAITLPTFSDVAAAATRIKGVANHTPLLQFQDLNDRLGGRILLKAEIFQRNGSFKFRGAFNFISQMDKPDRKKGVIAYSSGNHAQGVALAAKVLGVNATILMPKDAPQVKIQNTKDLGAEVILYDRYTQSREDLCEVQAVERGLTIVRPYDDPRIIAGQGTCGLEIMEQAENLGLRPDYVLTCCGGGGLTAGVSLAVKGKNPDTRIFTVEPEGYDDTRRSLESGTITANDSSSPPSICDAILTPEPGSLTFALNQKLVSGGLRVTDDEVRYAVSYAFRRLKLVIEPGGAVALAAVLHGKINVKDKTVALTLSGGNIDFAMLQNCLEAYPRD